MVQVAISSDFLKAFSKLPHKVQKKVRGFTEKFREDPTQASINYEPIHGMKDPKVRTVRIGNDYRAIVIHPPKGDVFLCVWVDHHDEAMAWAKNKQFEVHPTLGALQIYDVEAAEKTVKVSGTVSKSKSDQIPKGRLLSGHTDAELFRLGVPQLLIPSVRALRNERQLEELARHLPDEVVEGLTLLAAGGTLAEAVEEVAKYAAESVDTSDLKSALEHPDSKRRFTIVGSESELEGMLNAPLEHWRIFLHPSQRKLVSRNANGPMRVLGSAGTGKTVVLMHRVRYLAQDVFNDEADRLLVTTYTRNLANDIDRNLKLLCDAEKKRIEVTNLHRWAQDFLRSQGIRLDVVRSGSRRECWERAFSKAGDLSHSEAFLREEWDKVVLPQGVMSWEEYKGASRTGRGTGLNRKQRRAVWGVLELYRGELEAADLVEWPDIVREARLYLEKNPGLLPYRAVLADEVQDFTTQDLLLLRAMLPPSSNDLFLVGDAHQRIYGHKASLGSCGIEIRGRARRLKINYRTTQQVRAWACALLEGISVDDLDEGTDTLKGYRSLRSGPSPEVQHLSTREKECSYLVEQIRAHMESNPAEEICLGTRTNDLIDSTYKPLLEREGIPCVVVTANKAERDLGPGVRLATMHRMKGLEFPFVILPSVVAGVVPLKASHLADAASKEDWENQERFLLYVAATRARDRLLVTSYGTASAWLVGE